jgi:hypothetical protein
MPACCPVGQQGVPVVNADQTVIILWDAATKTQHFIRKASFVSEAEDFGFLVPSPTVPELAESGNDAFPYLFKLTEPEVKKLPRPAGGTGCGCGSVLAPQAASPGVANQPAVQVHLEKEVAGFKAAVLETKSGTDLVRWLKDNGYSYSKQVKEWAEPYLEEGWLITALKLAQGKASQDKRVAAAALRMSFKTERPLFPYREPDYINAVETVGAKKRLLRIYFLAEARYRGVNPSELWSGRVVWAHPLNGETRRKILDLLKLPPDVGPAEWWLTEFEDNWAYRIVADDLYFQPDKLQNPLKRDPVIEYVVAPTPWPADLAACAALAAVALPSLIRRVRRAGTSL